MEDLGTQYLNIYFFGFVFMYIWGLGIATVEDRMIIKNKKAFKTFAFFSATNSLCNFG